MHALEQFAVTHLHRSLPVNPILAHPVYLSGYIERLGTRTVDRIERCKEKGLKTPEFHLDEDGRVVIWRKNVTPTKTVLRAKDVLTAILSNKYFTTDELADMFKVAPRTIRRDLNLLRESYNVEWVALSAYSGYWKVKKK